MSRRKRSGHWCKICGETKANEKFTGKGHRRHICRECAKIPTDQRLEMMHIRTIVGLSTGKKDQRVLQNFIDNKKRYSERTRAFAREHMEMLNKAQRGEYDECSCQMDAWEEEEGDFCDPNDPLLHCDEFELYYAADDENEDDEWTDLPF